MPAFISHNYILSTVAVNIRTVDIRRNPTNVQIEAFCNYTLEPEHGLSVTIVVQGDTYNKKNVVNCTDQNPASTDFHNLEKKHTYTTLTFWVSESTKTHCSLFTPFNFTTPGKWVWDYLL